MPKGTALRNVRVEDTLWAAARAAAQRRGETLSEVIRCRLEEYVREPESQPREAE